MRKNTLHKMEEQIAQRDRQLAVQAARLEELERENHKLRILLRESRERQLRNREFA